MFRPFVKHGFRVGVASGMLVSVTYTQEYRKYDRNDVSVISGTASKGLASKVSSIIDQPLCNVETTRWLDGEILVKINETMRSKDVFVIQTCAAPVNDNFMELILSIAAAKRSGANSVTAVISYFGYNLNRRELPISTTHHSIFLGNTANDLAKMLQICGVDKIISVDLQRAGQGHEACFFSSTVPTETISSESVFIEYFASKVKFENRIVIVSSNTESVKKVRKFQKHFNRTLESNYNENKGKYNTPPPAYIPVEYAAFLRIDSDQSFVKDAYLELLGDVKGADVILLEDSAIQLSALTNRLKKEGAKRVFVAASHGLFTDSAKQLIDLSSVEQLIITDTIALPAVHSKKIVQVSVAPLLAQIITSDLSRPTNQEFTSDEDSYEFDEDTEPRTLRDIKNEMNQK